MHSIRIIGPGRAGTSLAAALSARGWEFAGFCGRRDDLSGAARGVDVLVIATPDDAIADVAAAVAPAAGTTVVHLSGSLGLDALAPHPLRAAVHPLVPLPNGEVGAARLCLGRDLRGGRRAGGPRDRRVPRAAGLVEVADGDRAAYHAAACIAANHVVALLGQVERVAAAVGLGPRVVPPPDPRRGRRRGRARSRRRAHRAGPAGRLGHAQPPPRRAARGRARRLPGRGGAGHPPGRVRRRGRPHRPHRPWRRSRSAGVDVVETVAGCRALLEQARAVGRVVGSGAHHGRAARRAHRRWWRGPAPTATWSRSASS